MIDFRSLSILLIHRELLPFTKQLLNVAVNGILKGFSIRKENGKIKGKENRMLKCSIRSKVWRLSGKSFKPSNYLKAVRL